jgi:hypothetical protein
MVMTNPISEDLSNIEAVADQLEMHRTSWEKRHGDEKTLKAVVADLQKDLDLAESVFNGSITGYAHGAAALADRITKEVKALGKGLEHAGKIPGLRESFLQDVRQFQADVTQYGKDMAQRVPQDAWEEQHRRGHVSHAELKMAALGDTINITTIEKSLSGSNVVTPELKHAAGLSLLERGELPPGIHRELGTGDPKAVSGPIKIFIDEEQERKIMGIPVGTRSQRYAVVDNGDDFYKVAVTKEYAHAKLGDFMGGMRAPGKPSLSSTGLCPQEQQHELDR